MIICLPGTLRDEWINPECVVRLDPITDSTTGVYLTDGTLILAKGTAGDVQRALSGGRSVPARLPIPWVSSALPNYETRV